MSVLRVVSGKTKKVRRIGPFSHQFIPNTFPTTAFAPYFSRNQPARRRIAWVSLTGFPLRATSSSLQSCFFSCNVLVLSLPQNSRKIRAYSGSSSLRTPSGKQKSPYSTNSMDQLTISELYSSKPKRFFQALKIRWVMGKCLRLFASRSSLVFDVSDPSRSMRYSYNLLLISAVFLELG